MFAASVGHVDILLWLIEKGADVEIKNSVSGWQRERERDKERESGWQKKGEKSNSEIERGRERWVQGRDR